MFVQKKIFIDNQKKLVNSSNFPNEIDYYNYLQDKLNEGLRQIKITSDIMIDVLKFYFTEKSASIIAVDFFEEDENFEELCRGYIQKTLDNRDYFVSLLESLECLYSEDSIDLKNIRFKYRESGTLVDLSIYINGNITVNQTEIIDFELIKLLNKITEFGEFTL